MTGGVFRVKQGMYSSLRGSLTVSGGLADFTGQSELLGAFRVPGTTTVCNAGIIDCNTYRLSQRQGAHNGASLNLCTGGVFKVRSFSHCADTGARWPQAKIDFNGGMLAVKAPTDRLLGNSDLAWITNILCFVREGGAIVSNDVMVYLKNPLRSGAENDGGLTKWGTGMFGLCYTNSFNGPLNIMQGSIIFGAQNPLLSNTVVNVYSGAVFNVNNGTQTVSRLAGSGVVSNNVTLAVSGTLAPGDGSNTIGTLTFMQKCKSMAGTTLETDVSLQGDADLLVLQGTPDLSQLSLKVMDRTKLDKSKIYTIVKAPNGFTGEFTSTNLDKGWSAHYNHKLNTVELYYKRGTVVMLM